MDEMNVTNEELNSLFELTEPETKAAKPEATEVDFVAPQTKAPKNTNEEVLITPETILDALMSTDEEGYSDAVMVADLARLHNVTPETTLENIPEEDHEYVDQMSIEGATFDMYTMDGKLFNMVLHFDSERDAYMKELNELLNRYRAMQEQIAENGEEGTVAMLSLTLMPNELNGKGALFASFPVSYFRVLDDNGTNASFLLQFYEENLEFMKLDVDEETRAEITADVMREMEEGTGGSLFEE